MFTSSSVFHEYSKAKHNREPAVATWVAIFNRAVKTNVTHLIFSPDWPGVALVGLDESSPKSVEQDKAEHSESFTFTVAEHDHQDYTDEDKKWIDSHCDQHEEPVNDRVRMLLHVDDHLHSHRVQ